MRSKLETRVLVHAALMGGLIFIAGLIRIPLGPVPFTLQTMFVLLSGMMFEPTVALSATLLHLTLKLVFAGAAAILAPSFGFVLAFIPAAVLLAHLSIKGSNTLRRKIMNLLLVSLLIYSIGLSYMAFILRYVSGQTLSLRNILFSGMIIFLPADILKAVFALILERRLCPLVAT